MAIVAINRIITAWPEATDDAAARGYGRGRHMDEGSSGRARCPLDCSKGSPCAECGGTGYVPSYPDLTGNAALDRAGSRADGWLEQVRKCVSELSRLGGQGLKWWPPRVQPGERIGDIVVGERVSDLKSCAECGELIGATSVDPLRHLDGKPYHQKPCWETARKRRFRASRVPPSPDVSHH